MTKQSLFFLTLSLVLLTSIKIFSQVESNILITQNGLFDTIRDRFGNSYLLSDLDRRSSKPIGGGTTVTAVPSASCQAGYFTLFFASGTVFTNTVLAQTVLCQVFTDISNLIISSCPAGAINIYCSDLPSGSGGALAVASPYISFPYGASNPNQGVVDNQIYKYLISGQNPYATLPLTIPSQSYFYHGMIQMKPNTSWNFNMSTTNISSNDYDAYTLLLHEVIHALGFYSLISATGTSFFGSANNYYSRYDTFLYDASGNPLLTSSSSSSCPLSNLSFGLSPSVLATTSTGCITDVTTCSTAVQYSSTNVHVKVYTPNCFAQSSSLSHFEDMCSIQSTVDLGCATLPNSTANNNLYYVMSNAAGTGSCYVKRHPKEEEKWTLCDMGYSLNATYGNSLVAGSNYTYPGGGCAGANVWGQNDGVVNGLYTFTAQTTVTNAIALPIGTVTGGVLSNDSPNATQISCLDVIYNNATAVISGTNLIVTINSGAFGLVVVRYLPKSSGNVFGSPTYIFLYFVPPGCAGNNACDLITNGGFETLDPSSYNTCGYYIAGSSNVVLNCWSNYIGSPDWFRRSCPGYWNLGGNTFGTPPVDSYNGTPNNAAVGISNNWPVQYNPEAMMANLSSALTNGQTYQLSLWALSKISNTVFPLAYTPIVINVRSMPLPIPQNPSTIIAQFIVMPGGQWAVYTNTFVFNSSANHSALVIEIDASQTAALGFTNTGSVYCFLDDVSLMPLPTTTFQIPGAGNCGNITFTNLAQYASPIAGVFTGVGVSTVSAGGGVQYNFNSAQTLTPGLYPVAFNYTTSNGCPKILWQSIVIAPQQTLSASGTSSICINSSSPAIITTSLSCSSCTNQIFYYWMPGMLTGATHSINPISTTIYTAYAFNGSCSATKILTLNVSSPSVTLSVSQSTICSGNSSTLTSSGIYTAGLWQPGSLSNPLVTNPTITTTYSFVATNSLGCSSTSTLTLNVLASPSLSLSLTTRSLCSNSTTLTATGSFSAVNWQPGNTSANSLILNPSVLPNIYTVTAITSTACAITRTIAYTPFSCCSSTAIPNFSATTITSNTFLVGPLIISSDFTVQSGATCVLYGGEFIFTNNAKITVASGGILNVQGAHLYACGTSMWKGIVVKSGGSIYATNYNGNDNLIEDAETAIDVSNYAINTSTVILNLSSTTFNKNYIDINLSNYAITSTAFSNPIILNSVVFTCRNFTYTSSSWPKASISDLRSAGNPTTGLSAPYLLQNAPIIDLKSPHTGARSHIAINLLNAGSTSTAYPAANIFTFIPVTIGSASSASAFVLFDAHETFISAYNSNLKVNNSVFQNTQSFTVSSTATVGTAIQFINDHISVTPSYFSGFLDLSATSSSVGSRFWDCHNAIYSDDATAFKVEHATFRSSHSNTTAASVSTGQTGIQIKTRRFHDYAIQNNEFTNMIDGVLIACRAIGYPYHVPGTTNWQDYLRSLVINTNTFSPYTNTAFTGTSTNYGQTAITISSPIWKISCYPSTNAIVAIQNNLIYRTYNGISLNGMGLRYYNGSIYAGPPKIISSNTISLEEDNVFNNAQVGIDYVGNLISQPISSFSANGRESIETNVISLYTGNTSNSNVSLIHTFNGMSTNFPVPYIICNTLTAAYQGFVFEGPNNPVYWRGNKMTSLKRGMTLSNSGVISQQGASTKPTDNVWNGSTWTSTNYGIYTNNSTASLSPLYVTSALNPPNPQGNSPLLSYLFNGINITSGSYTCGGGYNQRPALIPNSGDYSSTEMFYIAQLLTYDYLNMNDSLRNTDPDLVNFYTSLAGSSIDKFTQIGMALENEDYSSAGSILSGISTASFNTVESNTYNFYNLYLNFSDPSREGLSKTDKSSLTTLAGLCPGANGACVYQARALYLLVFGSSFQGPDACTGGAARYAFTKEEAAAKKEWDVDVFPNPATDQITIVSKKESEHLSIVITDLAGRTLMTKNLETNAFIVNLELGLINGAYLITISNNNHDTIIKKLLIAK